MLPRLQRVAARICSNPADAEELVQETAARLCVQGIPVGVRNPGGWVATILYNLYMDQCRVASRRPPLESFDDHHVDVDANVTPLDEPSDPSWEDLTEQDIRSALAGVSPMLADAFRMHCFEKLRYSVIAERLGINRLTVGTRINRARRRLRVILAKKVGGMKQ